jgi:acyl-coenzyme A thioesterase PaaI-like protein
MPPSTSSSPLSGDRVHRLWRRLAPVPGGRWLFNRLLGRLIPYSGALGAVVHQLEPGHARVVLSDRRGVRNHLQSVHAVALANLGELTSGLALNLALPPGVRGIVTGIEVEYHKKARGLLAAECRCVPPPPDATGEHRVTAHIRDATGDEVATFTARWMLGPVTAPAGRPS